MFSKNAWDQESEVDIHDVRIAAPDGKLSTSVWEMVNQAPSLLEYIQQSAFENVL